MKKSILFIGIISFLIVGVQISTAQTTKKQRVVNISKGAYSNEIKPMILVEEFDINEYRVLLRSYKVAVGKRFGDKKQEGDMRTPEGLFEVAQKQVASNWTHDFGDGKGVMKNAYGKYFIRLKACGSDRDETGRYYVRENGVWEGKKFYGIGIHGTCFPESLGTRCTEGCIRVSDEVLEFLWKTLEVGDAVYIASDETTIQYRNSEEWWNCPFSTTEIHMAPEWDEW